MSLLAPPLVSLARRKAALVKHHGPDDPRARAAAAELRMARVLGLLEEDPPLSMEERTDLVQALALLPRSEAAT